MLTVGNAQQQTFGGYIDGDGGGAGENKGDIFNNQQRLEAEMEGSGRGAEGADGRMMTTTTTATMLASPDTTRR